MATKAQIAANRANARKSTGPTSCTGKAKVANNARRHGATQAPEPKALALWLKVILDNPDATLDAMFEDNEDEQLALRLADAEVRLVAAKAALDELKTKPDFLDRHPEIANIVDDIDLVYAFEESLVEEADIEAFMEDCVAKERAAYYQEVNIAGYLKHEKCLLKRYVREAQNKRNRAFKAWIAYLNWHRDRQISAYEAEDAA
ncbi:MAG: hypothetical protein WBN88_00810 [Anderseniella sp.]